MDVAREQDDPPFQSTGPNVGVRVVVVDEEENYKESGTVIGVIPAGMTCKDGSYAYTNVDGDPVNMYRVRLDGSLDEVEVEESKLPKSSNDFFRVSQ